MDEQIPPVFYGQRWLKLTEVRIAKLLADILDFCTSTEWFLSARTRPVATFAIQSFHVCCIKRADFFRVMTNVNAHESQAPLFLTSAIHIERLPGRTRRLFFRAPWRRSSLAPSCGGRKSTFCAFLFSRRLDSSHPSLRWWRQRRRQQRRRRWWSLIELDDAAKKAPHWIETTTTWRTVETVRPTKYKSAWLPRETKAECAVCRINHESSHALMHRTVAFDVSILIYFFEKRN